MTTATSKPEAGRETRRAERKVAAHVPPDGARFACLKNRSTNSTRARSCLDWLICTSAKKPLPWESAKLCDLDDYITSTHRGHGHCLAKGASPDRMFAELLGKEAGYCRGKGGSMHIADPATGNLGANAIVGGSAGIATGAAFSAKRLGMAEWRSASSEKARWARDRCTK